MKFRLPDNFGRWAAAAVVAVIVAVLAGGQSGLVALWSNHSKTDRMKSEIVRLNIQRDSIDTVIGRLQHDTTYIERVAREKLGMARKDEKVFKFIGTK